MLKGSIPQNAHNGEYLKKVFAAADEELKKPDLALPYSKFRLFADTGNRLVYETDYIAHRKRLGLFAIMSLADGGEQWVRAAADTIWAILDEFTWALPAHLSGTPWEKKPYVVDLFAAETAFALSEVDALLGSRLPEPVRARMRRLIEERVINPFFAGEIHFHQSNWAAVQISGVIAPLCYFGWEDKLQAALPGIRAAYDQYFASFREDACCLEGALYWMFGFGYFCYGAEILRDATHGAVDYLAEARVQEIAKFPSRIALGKNAVIPFADGPHHLNYHIGLMDFLHSTFGVPQIPQENEMAYGQDDRYRLPDILRDLYWYDDAPRKAAAPEPRVDFPVSQWFVRRGALTLVVKGGTNREPHNHNDLGSVVLYDGDRFIVDDLGWSDYDKQYFSSERYTKCLCPSSRGHSVPIVDGQYQVVTDEGVKCALLSATDDEVALDIGCGYAGVGSVVRRVRRTPGGWIIDDEAQAGHSLVSRVATRVQPTVQGERVLIGGWEIGASVPCAVSVSQETFMPRLIFHNGDAFQEETAYLIDFTPKETASHIALTVVKA